MDVQDIVDRMAKLSQAEKRVVSHVAQGLKPAKVAERLGLKQGTVQAHTQNSYRKLGMSGRSLRPAEKKCLLSAAWRQHDAGNRELPAAAPSQVSQPGPAAASSDKAEHALHAGGMVAASVALSDPQSIRGITILHAGPNFEHECARLIRKGYYPEIVNDFQSTTHRDSATTRVIFVKREG